MVAMRGDKLRDHILWAAKDVFLEMGFERASMDVIAERASTSKRTLYAHFENKEKLYLAVVELVRGMFLKKLKTPREYSADPVEALTLFCGRALEMLLYKYSIRMCRMAISGAERLPEGSAQYYSVIFVTPLERLSTYLAETFALTPQASSEAADGLIAKVLFPRFNRALFGLDALSEEIFEEAIKADFDLTPIRKAVLELVESLKAGKRRDE